MERQYHDFKEAINHYPHLCSTIAMEEAAEFIQAVSKAKRGKLDKDNMAEEMADLMICMEWMAQLYNIPNEKIDYWVKTKTDRIVSKLNAGTFSR